MAEPVRHGEVSRIEGFSDAVFAFALTLLVVTLEAPKDVAELHVLVRGLLPFAAMFAMVVWIWYEHNIFFRRYGLQDVWTVFLNSVLLFVVLFYVYPLKFLTMRLLGGVEGGFSTAGESAFVMALYSSGVLTIFATFALLYRHAWGQRAEIGLTAAEELTLKFSLRSHLISVSLAALSLAMIMMFVLFGVSGQLAFAGWIYMLMGPLQAWNGYKAGAAHDALRKAALAAPVSAPAKQR